MRSINWEVVGEFAAMYVVVHLLFALVFKAIGIKR